ncbi:NB-ARC domain-containing protein [Bradyrhizobium sp. LA6.12]|uniref:NB-ARC domain-containing protein n=1 Tax=unclassified Bradyrhizobium TaxID=2631580 RepID=UPI0033913F4E
MIISQQRLTLFVLISAVETDVRQLIVKSILSQKKFAEVFPAALIAESQQRMQKSPELVQGHSDEIDLLDFMNLGDHFQTLNRSKEFIPTQTARLVAKNKTIETLVNIRNRVMHGRPLDFDDLPFVKNFCQELTSADQNSWNTTAELLKTLRRNPAYVFEHEDEFELEVRDTILNNLPSPDFDDTGFVGRADHLDRLKKAIKGSFPIITILGDGGLGKTSLALKALYDILDESSNQFDAIVWTTAKTTVLTADAIKDIEGSIKDSLSIFSAASAVLGGAPGSDPMQGLRQWLETFRILLVIDNLETVLDERIRRFAADIPQGSKILFTTRVGLGALDFPVELQQLSEREGVEYFKRICDVYGLPELQNKKRDYILDTCARLNFSPLAIKWFAQAIRAGGSPSSLLADPKLVLRFCVANVVDGLSQSARTVLDALIISSRPQTLSSLHFLLSEELIALSNALRELRAANLILITPSQLLGGDDFYMVKPLANFYVRNYFSPSLERQKELRAKQSQLSFARDRLMARRKGKPNIYDPNHIFIREEHAGSDFIVADYLSSALTSLRKEQREQAEAHLAKAMNMSPNYFEVHRVEAFMSFVMQNTFRAEDAYERAISLCGDYAPLRYFYAGFLIKIDEPERAVAQLEQAAKLDTQEASIKIQLARAYTRTRNFELAEQKLHKLVTSDLSNKAKKLVVENWFQLYSQRLNASISQMDLNEAFLVIEQLGDYVSNLNPQILDSKHRVTAFRITGLIHRFISDERGSERCSLARSIAGAIERLFENQASPVASDEQDVDVTPPSARQRMGTIKNIVREKKFGFIREDNGSEWFFHRNHMRAMAAFETVTQGDRVLFGLGENEQGPCAVGVELASKHAVK